MALEVTITGVEKVTQNLNKEIEKIIGNSKAGLISVGFLIKAASMRKAPVDLGNLRASHYVVWQAKSLKGDKPTQKGTSGNFASTGDNKTDRRLVLDHPTRIVQGRSAVGKLGVQVGVSAYYAIYVHENSRGANFTVGQSKFLEAAVAEVTPQALSIIKQKARL